MVRMVGATVVMRVGSITSMMMMPHMREDRRDSYSDNRARRRRRTNAVCDPSAFDPSIFRNVAAGAIICLPISRLPHCVGVTNTMGFSRTRK
jgi:hypothetical protein